MNSTNLVKPSDLLCDLKEKIALSLLKDMTELMMKIHHPDSGRVIESVLQLLPDNKMETLTVLCVGNEEEDLVQIIASTMVVRLASKQGIPITSSEMFIAAAKSFLLLINLENLRRKGHMEYLWPRNFFSDDPDEMAYNKLTEKGTEHVQKEFLKAYKGTGKLVQ